MDTLKLITQRRAAGLCHLRLTTNGTSYASLDCHGVMQPDGDPFTVRWRDDGTPTRGVKLAPDGR